MEIQPKDTSRGHFLASLLKSVLRFGACYCLWVAGTTQDDIAGVFLQWTAIGLALAEGLGVLEELV